MYLCILKGARGGVVFKVLRYKAAGRGFDSRWCHWNFSGRSMALESIQVYFRGVGGKGGRCIRLTTLPPSCAVTMKSGNLNFLEHSGPLQACNGSVLSLPFICPYILLCFVQ